MIENDFLNRSQLNEKKLTKVVFECILKFYLFLLNKVAKIEHIAQFLHFYEPSGLICIRNIEYVWHNVI